MTNLPAIIELAAADFEHDWLDQPGYEAIIRELAARRQADWLLLTRILRATGLREAEVLRLQPENVSRNGPETYLTVRRGKQRNGNGKYTKIGLRADIGLDLDGYMNSHRIAAGWPIFQKKANGYQRAFRKAALVATGQEHHPHELRGLYAKDLFDQGYSLQEVAAMLGHTSTKTTEQYYLRYSQRERAAINQRVRA